MKRSNILRTTLALALGSTLAWGSLNLGCNPNLLASLGGEPSLPTAPGTNPYVLVRIINSIEGPPQSSTDTTPAGVGFTLSWRYAGGAKESRTLRNDGLETNADFGHLLDCNVTMVTLGDVDDLTADSAWFIYNDDDDVHQPIDPLGKALQSGVDFRCGDVVTFIVHSKPQDSQSFDVDYQVQSGANVVGPFSGPDTFGLYDREVQEWRAVFGPVP